MKRLVFLLSAVVAGAPAVVRADHDVQGQPAPESADKLVTAFDRGLQGKRSEPTAIEDIFSKSSLKLKLRNYYLSRNRPEKTDLKAWAQGGSVEYKVDRVGGVLGVTAEYFGSFKLYGPDEHDGTLLLEPGQNNIDTFGVANPRLYLGGNVVSAYRQRFDLPYVGSQDNRMIPNTFEGYVVGMPKAENDKFQYVAGYISEIKTRNSETFKSMSEAAGVTDKERGMIASGARYYFLPDLYVAGINYFVDDVLNVAYGEGVYKVKIDEDTANTVSLQYSDQSTVGQDLILDDEYTTHFWGLQEAVSYKNLTGKFGYTYNDTGATLRAPWGSYPGYNSSMVEDFNRAGEKSWQVGLAYNFGRFNLKELGITAAYTYGLDAMDEVTKESIPDKYETDVTIDYKVQDGWLNGFWVRLRSAFINEDGKGTTEDYRIIVNYEIPILEPDAKG